MTVEVKDVKRLDCKCDKWEIPIIQYHVQQGRGLSLFLDLSGIVVRDEPDDQNELNQGQLSSNCQTASFVPKLGPTRAFPHQG